YFDQHVFRVSVKLIEGGMHLVRGRPIVHVTGCRQGTRAFTYNAPYARGRNQMIRPRRENRTTIRPQHEMRDGMGLRVVSV
ncbi:MAG: hypothetical protein ABI955_05525, partial [Nitrospirota bacterium]